MCYFSKESKYLDHRCCIPIQVGFNETKLDLGIQRDDVADNRGDKHPLYSEYSGIYWLWKNVDSKFKGVMHHRRFLTTDNEPFGDKLKRLGYRTLNKLYNVYKFHPGATNKKVICKTYDEYLKKVDSFLEKLPTLLNKYDIVTVAPYHYSYRNVGQAFSDVVNRFILVCVRKIFKNDYCQYSPYFEKTLSSDMLYYANLSVMPSKLFNEYCNFVFGLFDKLERMLIEQELYLWPVKEKSLYRVFGYLGELLTNAFFLYQKDHNKKIIELPLLFNCAAKGYETKLSTEIGSNKINSYQ